MLTLDLAMATHKPEGIERVASMMLPRMDGVRYIISWQAHNDYPVPSALTSRPDVEIHRFNATGQSLNRNNAIDHCTADIILHADDDVIYTEYGFSAIINSFQNNPDVDVATFRSTQNKKRSFPREETDLNYNYPKNYYAGAIEIAFRRSTADHLRCCPELGLASPRFHGAEDEMFLMSAIKRKLKCRYFPITICEHPGESTGTKAHFTNANLMAAGCLIGLTRPWTAPLRVPLKAWRVARAGQATLFRALKYITLGACASPGVLRRNHKYLW